MARKHSVLDDARRLGKSVGAAGREVWLAGLGAVAVADDRTRQLVDRLIEEGARFEKSDRNVLGTNLDRAAGRLRSLGNQAERACKSTVSTVLHRVGVPTRDEIRTLIDRVERLTEKVESR